MFNRFLDNGLMQQFYLAFCWFLGEVSDIIMIIFFVMLYLIGIIMIVKYFLLVLIHNTFMEKKQVIIPYENVIEQNGML